MLFLFTFWLLILAFIVFGVDMICLGGIFSTRLRKRIDKKLNGNK